ncbi:MAG: ABC transporter permease [Longimicrobiales bacterium]
MIELIRELRRAARTLSRMPGFTLACIATLAIGMGATTAVFSLVNAILLEPLPYPDSERLVAVGHTAPGLKLDRAAMSDGTYLHYRGHNRVFEEIGTYYENVVNLSGGTGDAERVSIAMVTTTFFSVLGARTVLGRLAAVEDVDSAGPVVVLISHGLWQRRYGADPNIVGTMIEANSAPRQVIGVLAPGFDFPHRDIDIWYPSEPRQASARASDLYEHGIARLRPGVDPDDAERDLNRLIASLPDVYADFTAQMIEDSQLRAVVSPLKHVVVNETRAALWLLFGGMVFLLLIACANVANLFLVRGEHRKKEIAIRTALGAARTDLARFFAAESIIIAALAGATGLLIADWAIQALIAWGPQNLPRLHEVGIDRRVFGFAAGLSVVTALLFSILPLFRYARSALARVIKESGSGATASVERQRVRLLLVTTQVALALTLLIGSALMARSFLRLARTDPGFDAAGVLTAEIAMPYSGYEEYADAQRFWHALLERIRALPGVEDAGSVSSLPLVPQPAYYDFALDIEGRPDETRAAVTVYHVTPGYFEAMRIPVVGGQGIPAELGAERPVLLSAAAARRLFPGEDPVGQRIRRAVSAELPWATVAGVVADVPRQQVGGDAAEIVYMPILENAVDPRMIPGHGTIAVRTSVPPFTLTPAIRRIVRELDPNLPLANIRTMDRIVADSMSRASFTMLLLIVAATAALFLGTIGLYGVISWAVSQRTREIGIRMALGARADDMQRMLLQEGARIAFAGVIAGTAAALALTRFLRVLLFEVSPTDPISFATMGMLLLATALLATWLPARRAARIDPAHALRAN